MFRVRGKSLITVSLLSFLAVMLALNIAFRPTVRVSKEYWLVSPDDRAIELVMQDGELEDIKRAVAESGKGIDEIEWMGGTLLYWAVVENRLDVAEWLLCRGASPNGTDPSVPPLRTAVARRNVSAIELLMQWGADPDLAPGSGISPRTIAESEGFPEVIAALSRDTSASGRSVSEPDGQ